MHHADGSLRFARRTMTTILQLTPQDHGRHVTPEEWELARPHSKLWKYEIIDGVINVTPPPGFGHYWVAVWLNRVFTRYSLEHPEVVNHVTQRFAVRVPNRPGLTEPEPDFGLYHLPADLDPDQTNWSD